MTAEQAAAVTDDAMPAAPAPTASPAPAGPGAVPRFELWWQNIQRRFGDGRAQL